MKKIIAILLVAVFMLALPACAASLGDGAKDTAKTAQPASENTVVSDTENNRVQPLAKLQRETSEAAKEKQSEASATAVDELISREKAVEIALQKSGRTRDEVYDLEAELDREHYGVYWEVDFDTREYEYSYDIDAKTGEIVHQDTEREMRKP